MPGQQPDGERTGSSLRFVTTFSEMLSRSAGEAPMPGWRQTSAPSAFAGQPVQGGSRSESVAYPWGKSTAWIKSNTSGAPLVLSKPIPAYTQKSSSSSKNPGLLKTSFGAFLTTPANGFAPPKISAAGREAPPPARPSRRDPSADSSPLSSNWITASPKSRTTPGLPLVDPMAPGPDFAAPPDQPSAASSDNASDNQSRSNQNSVTTLHIDGSALGRWAIQHLGRALGKPASGMTSVDPRAGVARTRVEPF